MEDVAVMALWCSSLSSLQQAVLLLLERVLSDPKMIENLETVVTDSLLVSKHYFHHWNQCLEEQFLLDWIEFEGTAFKPCFKPVYHHLPLLNSAGVLFQVLSNLVYLVDFELWKMNQLFLSACCVFDMVIFDSNSHVIIFTQTTNEFPVEVLKVSN